ncbi:ABC transporter substrate-binding protein [Cucumibacter marinus]|uniref:ABC transporter substrate-binding protein n=1 Tax=Cucumibacter marinus TaxID=1121252 RepID=UPI0004206E08|nr:ABC transporter substrate-binding protein [Cucumibacter marinus]
MKSLRRAALTALTALGLAAAPAAQAADLKIGNFLDVRSWDPALSDIGFSGPYLSAIYDPLIAMNAEGEAIPALATDWSYSDDFKTLTMHLREDVTFSDGEPFNAEAAVINLNHLKNGPLSNEAYLKVAEFRATGPYTIEIELTARDDSMVYLMALARSYMASPASIEADSLKSEPIGSGPYTLDMERSIPGSEYHFNKVADHWDAGTYKFDNLSVYPILDATARNNAMLSGQINVNFGAADNLQQAELAGWNIAQAPASWVGLQFVDRTGETLEPLGDVRVRQALNLAFNRAGMLSTISSGAGEVTNQVFVVGGEVNDPALLEDWAYDLERAKQLMADAGYADGFDVSMPMSPIFAPWQPIVTQTLSQLNINVTWDDLQMPDYQINAPNYPMFICVLSLDLNPPAALIRQVTSAQWFNPRQQYAEFPELKELADAALAATGDEQVEAMHAVNAKLTELGWWSIWYQAANSYFSTPDIEMQAVTGYMFPPLRFIQPAS